MSKVKSGRIIVEFTTDPHTPVMVYLGRESSTYECALAIGEVGETELTLREAELLESLADRANTWYNKYRDITA